jgi:hypothetical protein
VKSSHTNTSNKWYQVKSLPNLWFWCQSEIQDDHHHHQRT